MSTTYEEFIATLPSEIQSDKEKLLNVCAAAKVDVPLAERFYVKNHTPQKSKNNQDPQPTDYVVVPNPRGGRRDLWVHREDFGAFLEAGIEFGTRSGMVASAGEEE